MNIIIESLLLTAGIVSLVIMTVLFGILIYENLIKD